MASETIAACDDCGVVVRSFEDLSYATLSLRGPDGASVYAGLCRSCRVPVMTLIAGLRARRGTGAVALKAAAREVLKAHGKRTKRKSGSG